MTSDNDDRTFELVFADGKRTHAVFLTYLHFEEEDPVPEENFTDSEQRPAQVNYLSASLTLSLAIVALLAIIAYPVNGVLLRIYAATKMLRRLRRGSKFFVRRHLKKNNSSDRENMLSINLHEFNSHSTAWGRVDRYGTLTSVSANPQNDYENVICDQQKKKSEADEEEEGLYNDEKQKEKVTYLATSEAAQWTTTLKPPCNGQLRAGKNVDGLNGVSVNCAVDGKSGNTTHCSAHFQVLVTFYVLLRVGFAVGFTSVVISSAVTCYLEAAFDQDLITALRSSSLLYPRYSSPRLHRIAVRQFENEASRQTTAFWQTHAACENYTSELAEMVRRRTIGHLEDRMKSERFLAPSTDSSATLRIVRGFVHQTAEFKSSVANFSRAYRRNTEAGVRPWLRASEFYMQRIFNNPWFIFPQRLFNRTLMNGRHSFLNSTSVSAMFSHFLLIPEIESIHLWRQVFWHR